MVLNRRIQSSEQALDQNRSGWLGPLMPVSNVRMPRCRLFYEEGNAQASFLAEAFVTICNLSDGSAQLIFLKLLPSHGCVHPRSWQYTRIAMNLGFLLFCFITKPNVAGVVASNFRRKLAIFRHHLLYNLLWLSILIL